MEKEVYGYLCGICKTPNVEKSKYCVNCGQWLLSDLSKPKPISKKQYFEKLNMNNIAIKTNISLLIWFWVVLFFYYINSSTPNRFAITFFVIIVGFVNLIYPIPVIFNIKNRKQSFIILIVGVFFMLTAGN